ncbi:probable G-protein coupled receptor 139 [Heterodontus francisci]|uniref:probable G-protein coupled receptor 139 n=1 Tax=Heterodontus francisci TaxID=7792 RepID=UPI00355B6A28
MGEVLNEYFSSVITVEKVMEARDLKWSRSFPQLQDLNQLTVVDITHHTTTSENVTCELVGVIIRMEPDSYWCDEHDDASIPNLAVIVILCRRRCGLSSCITYYLTSMAVTDLLVMITTVILNRIVGIYFPGSFMFITPVCSLRIALNYAIIDCSVWVTVAFTFDRFMAICCQKLKIKYCTEKTAARVIGTVCTLSCLINTFRYFQFEPVYIINNVSWFCSIKLIFYTSPAWAAYDWIHQILTPCLPFILILLFNALTVRDILVASKARKRLTVNNNGENRSDPEMEKRRNSMVLLLCISGSFILLYLLLLINFLYVRIAKFNYFSGSNFDQSNFILDQSGYMLQLLSSSINPFIYAGTQRKFREELKNGVKYPLSLIAKLFK